MNNNIGVEMPIQIEANKKFLYKVFVPLLIVLSICTIVVSVLLAFPNGRNMETIIVLCVMLVLDIIFIIALIRVKRNKKVEFLVDEEHISYTKEGETITIDVKNISSMEYKKNKWYEWLVMIFFFVLGDSGSSDIPSIFIVEKNGTEHKLGFISYEDAMRLKELYKDLLTF